MAENLNLTNKLLRAVLAKLVCLYIHDSFACYNHWLTTGYSIVQNLGSNYLFGNTPLINQSTLHDLGGKFFIIRHVIIPKGRQKWQISLLRGQIYVIIQY